MTANPSSGAAPRLRLEFLDGLRGLAALYVVLSHAGLALPLSLGAMPRWASLVLRPLNFGHYAVAVFIVLSGFCLMLPVAASADGRLRGGWRSYLSRRARRILPPYYAAFLLSLMLVPAGAFFRRIAGVTLANPDRPTAGNIAAHLLLVHNWRPAYFQNIDGPLWSVATEWQIYFFLPFLLLPLWRRFGLAFTIVAAFAVGLAPHFGLPAGRNLDWACPWYLGLFALGMMGALISAGRSPRLRLVFERTPWGMLLAASAVLIGVGHFLIPRGSGGVEGGEASQWYMDIFCGAFSVCLILLCSRRAQVAEGGRLTGILVNALQSRPAMALGAMSYSVYLFHLPVLQCLFWLLCTRHLPFSLDAAVLFGLILPAALGVCYLFHLLFERPFMPDGPRSEKGAEKAAIFSPAP